MAKLTLNTIGSRYGSIDALNDNFNAIEAAIENTFSLDGTSPNALTTDLDVNGQDILNIGEANMDTLRINGVLVEPTIGVTAGTVFQTYEYTATAGQTSFSVSPATPYNASIVVIVNGLQLSPAEVSVSGTNVLTPALTLGDEVVIRRYTAQPVAAPDATEINFIQSGTGSITTTVQAKLRENISSSDYSTLQQALTAAAGKGLRVIGSYTLTATATVPANTYVFSQGGEGTITQTTAGQNALTLNGDGITIDGLRIVGINSLVTTASGIRADGRNNPTIVNCVINSFAWGVQLRGCTNARIQGNRFINGSYDASTSSDILLYGDVTTPGRRTVIIGNHCLSNNDNGISVDFLPGDRETIISGNVVAPCDSSGVQDIADASNRRRNGIIVGYVGGSSSRCVISSNIVRNATYGGIYMQGAAAGQAGDNSIVGNIVSRCSWGTAYPTDASLRAGIHYAAGSSDSISNNVIVDCSNVGIKVSPDYALSLSTAPRAVFSGNVIARTTGSGMLFTNKPYGYLVTGNRIIGSTSYGIEFQTTNSSSDIGNCYFVGNHIEQTSGSVAAMQLDSVYCTTYGNVVSNNKLIGVDNTTVSVLNAGVYTRGKCTVQGNHIQKFYHGVIFDESGSTRDLTFNVRNNTFVACNRGITGGQGTGTRIVTDNVFDTVTTKVSGCFEGLVVNDRVQVSGTATPVANTWAVGDYLRRSDSTVGAPKGYYCTVAGTPGTWVSEGNL